ncbi:uncharacterized protein JCM6883_005928 [Sporobolomyces salmoneus]|uniref:uncharacterized protein n=1 Tax=Sporobolomyces salmoneus TaxID=183962 RepID=UPI003176320B
MTGNLTISGIAAHTAPTGAASFFGYLKKYRKNKKRQHPSSELIYYEGLQIVRKFLEYASTHGVSDLQAFTAAHVPTPSWVYKMVVTIPDYNIDRAAELLRTALEMDPRTTELVGGRKWWTMRGRDLTGEWIEMKKDRVKRGASPPERVLLYLHGGAHFFSSLETHRYQIQRHARKLDALAFAPSQRLAPQYPFPCALHDALASYLFLIDPPAGSDHSAIHPSKIIISGDSAGGGLALSLLVLLRDLGLPQPAGATLISPWVDLSHSFPSVNGNDEGDYIPSRGFIYRPDLVWPPPPSKECGLEQVLLGEEGGEIVQLYEQVQMYCPNNMLDHPLVSPVNQGSLGGLCPLYIAAGSDELLRDEITYIAHKAANPSAYPPSSDVLEKFPTQKLHLEAEYPPTLVQYQLFEGGCHVATTLSVASIAKYIYRGAANAGLFFLTAAKAKKDREVGSASNSSHHHHRHSLKKHLHHDTPPQFHASPVEHEQARTETEGQVTTSAVNDEAIVAPALTSIDLKLANTKLHPDFEREESDDGDTASSASHSSDEDDQEREREVQEGGGPVLANYLDEVIKVTGRLPPFDSNHMIRQRVSNKGKTRPLEPASELPGCRMNPEHIGKVHAGPVRKWLNKRKEWDVKYEKDLEKWRIVKGNDRTKAQEEGFLLGQFKGENPPLCALAGFSDPELAQQAGESVDEVVGKKSSASMALAFWSKVSSKPDEDKAGDAQVKEMEEKKEQEAVQESEKEEAATVSA